jgi:hypothetical protein
MKKAQLAGSKVAVAVVAGALLAVTGCSDTDQDGPNSGGVDESPLYALHLTTMDATETYTSYIVLTDTLDLESVTLDQAREFAGFTDVAAIGGKLLVSSSDTPVVTSYSFTSDREWIDGASVSFADYGTQAGFWNQFILNENAVYTSFDVTSRVLWNPTTMEIEGVREDSALELEHEGLGLEPTVSRQVRPARSPVLRPFYYHDEDYFQFGAQTPVAVYDPDTHEEAAVLDLPCPAVEVETRDEDGYAYFSAWTYGPDLGLYGVGPVPCVARVTPDQKVDREWSTDLRSWTGGQEIGVFRYIGGGKAVATVLDHDLIEADFDGPFDVDVSEQIHGADVWRLWLFDLAAEVAAPIEGLELMNRGFSFASFEGRTFVMLPFDDWSKSRVYEINGDGRAEARFETTASLYDWVRVR